MSIVINLCKLIYGTRPLGICSRGKIVIYPFDPGDYYRELTVKKNTRILNNSFWPKDRFKIAFLLKYRDLRSAKQYFVFFFYLTHSTCRLWTISGESRRQWTCPRWFEWILRTIRDVTWPSSSKRALDSPRWTCADSRSCLWCPERISARTKAQLEILSSSLELPYFKLEVWIEFAYLV